MHIIVIDICKSGNNQVRASILINDEELVFDIRIVNTDGIKCLEFHDNGQFTNLETTAAQSRYFIDLVFSVYANKSITFPIDL